MLLILGPSWVISMIFSSLQSKGEGCFRGLGLTCLREVWKNVICLIWSSLGANSRGKNSAGVAGWSHAGWIEAYVTLLSVLPFRKLRTVEHLVKTCSDHNPLLLRYGSNITPREGRPFRLLAAWCGHPNYRRSLQENWALLTEKTIGNQ